MILLYGRQIGNQVPNTVYKNLKVSLDDQVSSLFPSSCKIAESFQAQGELFYKRIIIITYLTTYILSETDLLFCISSVLVCRENTIRHSTVRVFSMGEKEQTQRNNRQYTKEEKIDKIHERRRENQNSWGSEHSNVCKRQLEKSVGCNIDVDIGFCLV